MRNVLSNKTDITGKDQDLVVRLFVALSGNCVLFEIPKLFTPFTRAMTNPVFYGDIDIMLILFT